MLAKRSCTEVNVLQYYIVLYLLNKLREHGSLHPAAAPKVIVRRVVYSTTQHRLWTVFTQRGCTAVYVRYYVVYSKRRKHGVLSHAAALDFSGCTKAYEQYYVHHIF